jgi:hypothetical protein
MIPQLIRRLPVRVVRWTACVCRGGTASSRRTEMVRDSPAARRVVLVTTNDAGMSACSVVGCGRAAELLISVRPAPAGTGLWPSCVDHWGSVRSVFVGRGDRIDYGPEAPERIIQRTAERLKSELGRLDPVRQPAQYNRLFGDLVAVEQQRRRLEGEYGREKGPGE